MGTLSSLRPQVTKLSAKHHPLIDDLQGAQLCKHVNAKNFWNLPNVWLILDHLAGSCTFFSLKSNTNVLETRGIFALISVVFQGLNLIL